MLKPPLVCVLCALTFLGGTPRALAAPVSHVGPDSPATPHDDVSSDDVLSDDGTPEPERPASPDGQSLQLQLGLLTQLISGKPNAGIDLRMGRRFALRAEANLRWTSEPIDEVDARFLGIQWGAYLEAAPISTDRFELDLGVGADMHSMFNIHSDFFEVALSTAVNGTFWFAQDFGATLGLRAYPLATSGLELGTERSGARANPILVSLGLKWRSP